MRPNEVALWPPQNAQLMDTLIGGQKVDARLPTSRPDDQSKLSPGGVVCHPFYGLGCGHSIVLYRFSVDRRVSSCLVRADAFSKPTVKTFRRALLRASAYSRGEQ